MRYPVYPDAGTFHGTFRSVLCLIMLKNILVFLILISITCQAWPQGKRRDRVKRKYQQEDEVDKRLPLVKVYGRVQDIHRERIQGARVTVNGTRLEVHTNDLGEYFLKGMNTGRVRIVVSCAGFESKYIDYVLQEGNNTVYFTLDKAEPSIRPVMATAQLREQQLPDIPGSVQVLTNRNPLKGDDGDLSSLLGKNAQTVVPGWSPFQQEVALRGASEPKLNLSSPSSVSVYWEDVPVEGMNPFTAMFYDVKRVEVLKGPQSTLFGGGGTSGGLIRVIPENPAVKAAGYLQLGGGDFQSRELQSAIGFPLVKNRADVRLAGMYATREGYIPNSYGGFLNGKNSLGGRVTAGILPAWNFRMNITATWQKEDIPGLALVNPLFPNENGERNFYSEGVSLNEEYTSGNNREVAGALLEGKWLRNANNYLKFTTSGFKTEVNSAFDADGTQAPALGFIGRDDKQQLTQEIRYNFSRKSRINGAIGAFGRWLTTRQESRLYPDEQYLAYLMLELPEELVSPEGQIRPLATVPVGTAFGALSGLSLPPGSEEVNLQQTDLRQVEIFVDATWRLTPRFSLTTGVRGAYQWLRAENETPYNTAGISLLGQKTGKLPQLFFQPDSLSEIRNNRAGLSFRANLKMDIAENATGYAGFSKGYRPPQVYFHPSGEGEVLESEKVNSLSIGYKSAYGNRLWLDFTGYYQISRERPAAFWEGYGLVIQEVSKILSMGAEADVKAVLLKGLTMSGSYAFTHARFPDDVSPQFAGKSLRLTPGHQVTVSADLQVKISPWARFLAFPAYSWKSRFWFDDVHSPGTEQPAFGVLDVTAGVEFPRAGITLSCTGTNLTGEQYLLYAGQTANLFPVTLVMPGPPRMISGRILWRF
jgi:outer membrane receptor protein involved in Fe transport